jgi:4-carboxymuconolactone decarboxylase
LVILVTAAKFGARYEIYGHEYFARRAGLAEHKIATIAAGERPGNLSCEEDRLSVGCFSMVGITLNGFDAPVPGRG